MSQAAREFHCIQPSIDIWLPWSPSFVGHYSRGVFSLILKHQEFVVLAWGKEFLPFQQLSGLVANIGLFDCISAWEQTESLASSNAPFCTTGSMSLLFRCGTVVASLPALDRGMERTCGSVQKVTALLTRCHHMSHLRVIIFQEVWAAVRKILVWRVFWALAQLDPSFHAVSHCLLLQTNLRAAHYRARGKFPKCS